MGTDLTTRVEEFNEGPDRLIIDWALISRLAEIDLWHTMLLRDERLLPGRGSWKARNKKWTEQQRERLKWIDFHTRVAVHTARERFLRDGDVAHLRSTVRGMLRGYMHSRRTLRRIDREDSARFQREIESKVRLGKKGVYFFTKLAKASAVIVTTGVPIARAANLIRLGGTSLLGGSAALTSGMVTFTETGSVKAGGVKAGFTLVTVVVGVTGALKAKTIGEKTATFFTGLIWDNGGDFAAHETARFDDNKVFMSRPDLAKLLTTSGLQAGQSIGLESIALSTEATGATLPKGFGFLGAAASIGSDLLFDLGEAMTAPAPQARGSQSPVSYGPPKPRYIDYDPVADPNTGRAIDICVFATEIADQCNQAVEKLVHRAVTSAPVSQAVYASMAAE